MLMFQGNISFIVWISECFTLEQEDITCLQNVRNHSSNDTAAHPRRPESPLMYMLSMNSTVLEGRSEVKTPNICVLLEYKINIWKFSTNGAH